MHPGKIDTKGRLSVPSPFRAVLRQNRELDDGSIELPLVLLPSKYHACIEGWSEVGFQSFTDQANRWDVTTREHQDVATAIYGQARWMETDKEGRIVLPEDFVRRANITGPVTFIGVGRFFQIWEPDAAGRRLDESWNSYRTLTAAPPTGAVP